MPDRESDLYQSHEFRIGAGPVEQKGESLPPWRDYLDREVRARLEGADPSHDILHVRRVQETARSIADFLGMEPGEWDITEAIIKGHDIQTYSKNIKKSHNETEESADIVEELLKKTNFPPKSIERVKKGILSSSLKKKRAYDDLPGFLASVADKLDQTGAIFVTRYASSSGVHPMMRKHFNKKDPFGKGRELKEFQFTLDAMLARRPKVEAKLDAGIDYIKATAEHRNKFIDVFLEELKLEIEEEKIYGKQPWAEKTGAMGIMHYFKSGGKKRKPFYNPEAPFGNGKRKLEPEKYSMDAILNMQTRIKNGETFNAPKEILERRQAFIAKYIHEFKMELVGMLVFPMENTRPIKPWVPQ